MVRNEYVKKKTAILVLLLLTFSACTNQNRIDWIQSGQEEVEEFSSGWTNRENSAMGQAGIKESLKIFQRSRLDENTELETRITVFLDQQGGPSEIMNPIADSIVLKNGQEVLFEAESPQKLHSWAFFNTDRELVIWVSIVQEDEQNPQKKVVSYQTEIELPDRSGENPRIQSFMQIDSVPMNLTFKNPNENLNPKSD